MAESSDKIMKDNDESDSIVKNEPELMIETENLVTAAVEPTKPDQLTQHTQTATKSVAEITPKLKVNKNKNRTQTSTDYKCKLCDTKCSSSNRLAKHFKKFHLQKINKDIAGGQNAVEKPTSFNCIICDKQFSFAVTLEMHMRQHVDNNKLFKCDKCVEGFKEPLQLKLHIGSHDDPLLISTSSVDTVTADKSNVLQANCKFVCKFCNGLFTGNEIKRHLARTHYNKNKLKCHICCEIFPFKRLVFIHIRDTHQKNKDFPCLVCFKPFNSEVELESHRTMHTRPYKCNICQFTFTSHKLATSHHLFHNGNCSDVLKCKTCDKAFDDFQKWHRHMRQVHADFQDYLFCVMCGTKYSNHRTTKFCGQLAENDARDNKEFYGKLGVTFTTL